MAFFDGCDVGEISQSFTPSDPRTARQSQLFEEQPCSKCYVCTYICTYICIWDTFEIINFYALVLSTDILIPVPHVGFCEITSF